MEEIIAVLITPSTLVLHCDVDNGQGGTTGDNNRSRECRNNISEGRCYLALYPNRYVTFSWIATGSCEVSQTTIEMRFRGSSLDTNIREVYSNIVPGGAGLNSTPRYHSPTTTTIWRPIKSRQDPARPL